MAIAKKLLTAEEFWLLSEGEGKRELVRGEVVEWMPVGGVHGEVVRRLLMRLGQWAEQGRHGYVATEVGYVVRRNPDGVRAADVSFVRQSRIPPEGIPEGFWPFAPDLAVEVVSPFETAEEVWEKVSDYLSAGTRLVWVIYPRSKQAVVYTPDGIGRTVGADDLLEDESVLPGFSCKLSDLF
ncbi:Uma2 family endonuclease [Meiothermus sp. CFH 77666]|uniref:Uma2 family endonuclease n=1 Tax=Meiothermus sp. CFH 77666 TaxID=2817942 RepID=UPI001AA0778D|nr:Uma2 family endonuclease [Meiothermus sp. CFH 77666]MBO1438127.1 Uma2 family endonuclease [Meiothermus sp. CFH 77666]